ncbi:YybH family protein [Salinimicrobium gaetbulicola]|uniref:YybH family protein n=1 Tax=Salinimicrobium gaetbulicola TaxID=999702 RepID=A0ABW3IJ12_9FLAO
MKLIKLIPLLALLFFMGACGENRSEEVVEEDEMVAEEADMWDSNKAMTDWRDAWNKNDAAAVESMTADDATLFLNGKAHTQDSVTAWIQNSSSWMKDLKTTSVYKDRGEEFAFEAGTYTHSHKENDTLSMQGTYTVIWERGDGKEWAIKLMDVSPMMDAPPMPSEKPKQ